ncbi:MAG: ABC transporter permease subunit [Oscillospiraceae bacterium]|nr:ABC transporter permease subunit [Oscillospiraceae bacterium]
MGDEQKKNANEAKLAAKRDKFRAKNLAKFEKETQKAFAEIDRAEAREKSATQDPTKQREIELLAAKKRDELTKSSDQRKRAIMSSTGSRLSYERKKGLYGYGFIAIWAIGVIFIFAGPLISSMIYSLTTTSYDTEDIVIDGVEVEIVKGINTEWNGFANFKYAMGEDPNYSVNLMLALGELGPNVAMILVFSLFVAILLNQKFKGRTLMRAIFFFPVLIATGPVISVINGGMAAQGTGGDAAQLSAMFSNDMVDEFLAFLGIHQVGEDFTNMIAGVTSDVFNLLWKSGIQILIFLSALQQIPTSAREAASMEGATSWEFFWKITFPTISPMILANLIYTIIDTFSDADNVVMAQVLTYTTRMGPGFYGQAAAFAWIYFGIIAVALAIVVAIVSKFVFYQVD